MQAALLSPLGRRTGYNLSLQTRGSSQGISAMKAAFLPKFEGKKIPGDFRDRENPGIDNPHYLSQKGGISCLFCNYLYARVRDTHALGKRHPEETYCKYCEERGIIVLFCFIYEIWASPHHWVDAERSRVQ